MKSIFALAFFSLASLVFTGNLSGARALADTPPPPSTAPATTTTTVCSVATDAYDGTEYLDLVRDNATGTVVSMTYRDTDQAPVSYTVSQLRTGPQLLKTYDNHQISFVSIEDDFNPSTGGHINVRFLHNGITGSYENFRVLMQISGAEITLTSDPNSDDPDSDGNTYSGSFNHLFMQKSTFFGQIIGINQVIPSEQAAP